MKHLKLFAAALYFAGVCLGHAAYHTNLITTPDDNFAFSVDGSSIDTDPNPTIQLQAGVTNILDIQTFDDHPVVILNSLDPNDWYGGANPQNVNTQPISLTTPTTGFPTVLYYMCYIHQFYGEIDISAPSGSPMPLPNTILEVRVGTNIVMTSTGTNTTWNLVPEYSSNLCSGIWSAVPNFTNFYANGTNTTIFPRLDPICGPNVFLRTRFNSN